MTASSIRRALVRSGVWFALAVTFGLVVTVGLGARRGAEFFTAYAVEQALSIDNLFVIMLVFARFRVPREAQRRALTWGLAGVVVLRGLMIVTGTALVGTFHALTYALGLLLVYSAVKLAGEIAGGGDGGESTATDPIRARVRSIVSRILPVTDGLAGERFTIVQHGKRYATPLLLAVVTVEIADAIFALDSIPAVFGVTTDRFIVFTSNLFAVLGLRSLYFAVSGWLDRLTYLKHGLVGLLAIIGAKMVLAIVWPAPAWLSLVIVAAVLGGAIGASLVAPTRKGLNAEQS